MKNSKIVISLLLCLAVFTGCGPKGSGGSTGNEPVQKDKIVIAFNYPITDGSPQMGSSAHHYMLYLLSHNRLVSYNAETQQFSPEIATEWKWVSDKEIEFKIRPGVTFHNGDTMTIADVLYTFESAKTSKSATAQMAALDKVEAVGDDTVRMTLKAPNVDWLFTLSLPMCSIVSGAAIGKDPAEGGFIGTGAFKITKFSPSDFVDLTRNDQYWGELPKTKDMTIRYVPEDSARLIALQNGEIDICLNPANTELHFIEDDPKLSLVQYNSTATTYIAFNSAKAPTDNADLRLALAYCLNFDDIVTVATNGLAAKAVTNWGPVTYGYYDGFGPYGQDLGKAREHLAKAFPQGNPKLELAVAGSSDRMAAAQVIQEQARAIGLEITINEMEGAAFNELTAFRNPKHQAIVYGLQWNNHGDDARRPYYPGNNVNRAAITDNRITALLNDAIKESDDTSRKAMYQELQQINHDKAYYINLYYTIQSHGVNKNLSGVVWAANGYHNFTYASVTK